MVASTRSEVSPVAAGPWLAWTVEAGAGLRRGEILARRDGGRTFSVNGRAGTGLTGAISGATLVYERIAPGGRESDIRLFDLEQRRGLRLPGGVNTKAWERAPSLSGDWLLFVRGREFAPDPQLLLLRNLRTGAERRLDALRGGAKGLLTGQLAGRWAAWTRCIGADCQVSLHDLRTATTRRVAAPAGLVQYAASVRRDGTLVFGRSVGRCGVGVQLVERTLAGRERVLARLPENVAFATTYSAAGWVYYDRVSCRRFAGDVYRVRTG